MMAIYIMKLWLATPKENCTSCPFHVRIALCLVSQSTACVTTVLFVFCGSFCAARWSTTARKPKWRWSWACRTSPSPTTKPSGPWRSGPRPLPTCWSVRVNTRTRSQAVLQSERKHERDNIVLNINPKGGNANKILAAANMSTGFGKNLNLRSS